MNRKLIIGGALNNVKTTGRAYGEAKRAFVTTGKEIRGVRRAIREAQMRQDYSTVSILSRLVNLLVDEVKSLDKERSLTKAAYHLACNIHFGLAKLEAIKQEQWIKAV